MFELDEVVLELIVMGKKGVSGENLGGEAGWMSWLRGRGGEIGGCWGEMIDFNGLKIKINRC